MTESLGTFARVLAVLRILAETQSSVGVKDISSALDLPMSTSHRLLDMLLNAGFVEKSSGTRRYEVGAEFFRIANLVTQKTSIASIVQPFLDELAAQTGETAIFSMYLPKQKAMVIAAKSDSTHALRHRFDLFVPKSLAWGSTGLAILAFLPQEVQEEVFRNITPSSFGKTLNRKRFFARISKVQADGFAVTDSENLPESIGIAAPLEAQRGNVVGSIALTIPKVRITKAALPGLIKLVCASAAKFSRPALRTAATK